ncbi:MAG TPA: hypothetical protein VMX17_02565 [Candidatus Glassbacteria bacterium]|nr:hypothetical protein [Candidatus Glassbacteria bacterium]
MSNTNASGGIGLFGIFFIVLFLLKVGVANTIVQSWSWWWITAPLWGSVALVLGIILVVGLILLIFGK